MQEPQYLAACIAIDRGPKKHPQLLRVQFGHLPVLDRPSGQTQQFDVHETAVACRFVVPEGHTSANEGEKPPRIPSTNPFKKK